jgi:prephenate dehydratase
MGKWAIMADFSIRLPDRPGELARLAAMMREAGVNLVGLWGYGEGRSQARFYCVPERPEHFRDFARTADLPVEEGKTFYLTGADQPGVLVDWLKKIGSAGINLQAIEAVRIHGVFGVFIWADSADWYALTKLLTSVPDAE